MGDSSAHCSRNKAGTMAGEDDGKGANIMMKLVNFVPPMVVTGIILIPYIIYVFVNCKILLEDKAPGPMFGVICLVIFHILIFFLVWSFSMSIMVDPGRVPEWYARLEMERQGMHVPGNLFEAADEAQYQQLVSEAQGGSIEKKLDGSGRWCRKCVKVKPDRCHHCRICQRCVLKMDHHCPWINNCVGYYNYKYFYLFILYALLILFWVSSTSFLNFLRSVASDDVLEVGSFSFLIVFCWIYCTLFGVALGGFVTFHTYLLVQNYTTIELVEKKGSPTRGKQYVHPWDLGMTANIEECLGKSMWLWMIPTRLQMRGNGVRFRASAEYQLEQAQKSKGTAQ